MSASFQSVPNFIEHKRLNHFLEFQNTAVILFEETRIQPYNQTPTPKDRLIPKLEPNSALNSESSLTTTKDGTPGNGNKSEDFPFSIYPCTDVKSESGCGSFNNSGSEAEVTVTPQIISVTSNSQQYIKNSSDVVANIDNKIFNNFQPAAAELKEIGLTHSRNIDNTRNPKTAGQCSKIQQKIITYNDRSGDTSDNISVSVQPKTSETENPYILLRRLTAKQIQNYSPRVNTTMQPDLLLSGNEKYDLELDQAGDPDPVIFLRPKVEILEECDDEPRLADYTCKFCKSHFVSCTALQIHLQTCVPFVPTSHSYCTLCNSHFSNSHDLQTHNLTQHGHEMDMNSGQFFQNRKGTGMSVQVQPYKCNVCGSWFITKASLVNHLFSHSEDRPFPCRYPGCGKSFKTVHTLASHRSTHNKGFSCKFPNCELTFGTEQNLKDHVRTHLNKL